MFNPSVHLRYQTHSHAALREIYFCLMPAGSCRVRLLSNGVGNLSIGTIGPRWCVGHGAEDAEIAQLAGVGTSVWIVAGRTGFPKESTDAMTGAAQPYLSASGCSISPAFPISENPVSGAVRENNRSRGLALPFKLLVVQCKEECLVANDRTAYAHGCLVSIDPGG